MKHQPKKLPKKQKHCTGCGEAFWDYGNNFDYCESCAINNNRYAQNQCPECGDGSGWIQFPNQTLRACKLCALNSPANPPTMPPNPTKKSMTKLHKYPKKNFTCDGCQTALKNAGLYSPATNPKNLSKNKTYCGACAKQLNTTTAKQKVDPKNQNTLAYYQCLSAHSQQGFKGKISQVCRECKNDSQSIITQRTQQTKKLVSVYKQLGVCLERLLHPRQPAKKTQKKISHQPVSLITKKPCPKPKY